jgi:hypothetical protein
MLQVYEEPNINNNSMSQRSWPESQDHSHLVLLSACWFEEKYISSRLRHYRIKRGGEDEYLAEHHGHQLLPLPTMV